MSAGRSETRKNDADDRRQLLGDVGPVAVAVHLVGVEAVVDRRHDDREPARLGVPLDRGVARPRGVVVGQPVQQVEHRRRPVADRAGDADLLLGRLGEHHRDRGADLEGLGEEVAGEQGHAPQALTGGWSG